MTFQFSTIATTPCPFHLGRYIHGPGLWYSWNMGWKLSSVCHPSGSLFTDCVFITTLFAVFKVYYLPFGTFHNQCALPTLYTTLPLMRCIFLREKITIVHGHSVSLQMIIIIFVVVVVLLIMRSACDIHCIIDKLQDPPLLCLHL